MAKANPEDHGARTFWHGSPSGDMRGGEYGLHIGSHEAARQALTARIGHPAEGTWDGTREYGKTLLAGKNSLHERGEYPTGYSANAPGEDHFPTGEAKYGDGSPILAHHKPDIFPVRIKGEMSNNSWNPHEDFRANAMMKGQLKRGNAKRGYYYTNIGEDEGSISAVVPGPEHVEMLPKSGAGKHSAIKKAASRLAGQMREKLGSGSANMPVTPVPVTAAAHEAGHLNLYHRTTPEHAEQIYRGKSMHSRENHGKTYWSTFRGDEPNAQNAGYGAGTVHIRVPDHLAEIDDEFPSGEEHYRVHPRDLQPHHFVEDQ